MVVGKYQTVWRNDYARAIAREVDHSILQGVLAVVELVVSHTEAFALHHLIHSVWQVVNCPHSLVSVRGIDSAEGGLPQCGNQERPVAGERQAMSIQKYVFIKDVEDEEISFSGAISRWKESKEKVHTNYSTLIDLLSNGNI